MCKIQKECWYMLAISTIFLDQKANKAVECYFFKVTRRVNSRYKGIWKYFFLCITVVLQSNMYHFRAGIKEKNQQWMSKIVNGLHKYDFYWVTSVTYSRLQ